MKVNAADRSKWGSWRTDDTDYNVELLQIEKGYWPTWAVWYHGEMIGSVEKGTRTWERSTKGRRYVNARGQVTAWTVKGEQYPKYSTRNEVIRELVRRAIKDK